MKRKSKTQEIRETKQTKMCHVSDVPKIFPLTAGLLSGSGTIQENQDLRYSYFGILNKL